jgi:TorA maturation chaperone TorD
MNRESVNPARSLYYGLMSKFLVFTTKQDRFDGVEKAIDVMIENPMDENSLEALKELQEFIKLGGHELLSNEYDAIFNTPSGQVVRTTASYYHEGVESGKKRVEVKNFLAKTRIRRNEKEFKENEDSVGFIVTFMHELIELIMKGEKSYETVQHCLFTEIINEFFDEFIESLYKHKKANAYKSLAVVLNAFLEFERLYFDVTKPAIKEKVVQKAEACEVISDAEAKRRAENRAKREADAVKQSCSLENSMDSNEDIEI